MTKETKVGLLIGLGVILLIGIILTDHLSVAQKQQPPRLTDFASEAQEGLKPPAAIETNPVVLPRRAQTRRPATPATPQRTSGQRTVTNEPLPRPLPATRVLELPVNRYQSARPPLTTPEEAPPPPQAEAHAPLVEAPPIPAVVAPPTITPPRRTRRLRTTPAPVFHVVKEDENLWLIAQRYLGNGRHWKKIKDANPRVVSAENQVNAGVRLKIPNKADHPDFVPVTQRQTPTAPKKPVPRFTFVTVQPGETLTSIATRVLNDPKSWRLIYEANRDRLSNPDHLRSGRRLKVPLEP